MTLDLTNLAPRARSWNEACLARPGDVDLTVPSSQVVGTVPPALRGGRLWSNGPGWNLFHDRLAHPFDGHGYVRRFSFAADGSVQLEGRFVRTAAYEQEAPTGTLQVRGLATNPTDAFWKNLRRGEPRNVANTTVVRWGDRLLAGWEGGAPYGLDPDTLQTLGPDTFGGLLDGQVTLAHMHEDAARRRLLLCSVAAGRQTAVTLREVDVRGELLQTRTGVLPGIAFAHDFAFTDHWYLFGGNPLSVKPLEYAKAVFGASTLLRSIKTRDGAPGTLVLVPRDVQGQTRVITLPEPAFVVHFANAFERDGDLVIDACVFHRFEFGEEFGYAGPHAPLDPALPDARGPQRLYRITVPAGSDEATWRPLAPHGIDFPRVHPQHEGQDTPFLVGACRADPRYSDPFDSVVRVDLRDPQAPPQLWTAPEQVFVGEPLVLTGPDGQASHVAVLLSHGLEARTTLAVFDSHDLSAGPVVQVPLPLLPVAFHGSWEPARA